MSEIGQYLKKLRGNRSLREIEKLSGVSHTYLSSLEKGEDPRTGKKRTPTPETLMKLAKTYNHQNYERLYWDLMHMAGHAEFLPAPPATVDFMSDDLKIINFWFNDLKKKFPEDLRRLEEDYQHVLGNDFIISPESLEDLLWEKPFRGSQLFEKVKGLIEKVKDEGKPATELDLKNILGDGKKVNYNGHPLTDQDQGMILSMLDALFRDYAKSLK